MKRILIILAILLPFLMAIAAFGIEKEKAPKESSGAEQSKEGQSGISRERPSFSKPDFKTKERPEYDEFIDKNEDGIDDRAAPRKTPQKVEETSGESPAKSSNSPKDTGKSGKSSDDTVVRRKSR